MYVQHSVIASEWCVTNESMKVLKLGVRTLLLLRNLVKSTTLTVKLLGILERMLEVEDLNALILF